MFLQKEEIIENKGKNRVAQQTKRTVAKKTAPTVRKNSVRKTTTTGSSVKKTLAKKTPAKKTSATPAKKKAASKPVQKKSTTVSSRKTAKKTIAKKVAPAKKPVVKNTSQPIDRTKYNAAALAMLDTLCEDGSLDRKDLVFVGAKAALADDYNWCIEEGRRLRKDANGTLAEAAMSGARSAARTALRTAERSGKVKSDKNDDISLSPKIFLEWAKALDESRERKPKDKITVQPFGNITSYGDYTEWEGWSYAPLRKRDVAHVRLVHAMPLDELRDAFPGWDITESSDGLVSISAKPGAPVKTVVAEWLAENKIPHEGVRDALGRSRRDLNELPPEFLNDLIVSSIPLAQGIVSKRHGAAMEVLADDPDDVRSWIRLWVVELAATFNAELGRPFGTWVTSQIKFKIQDLNREINGRTASDLEMKYARAQEKITLETGRTPEPEELAQALGFSMSQMHAKRAVLSRLRSIRSAHTLDTAPDAPDLPIVDVRANPEKDALMREQASRITMALLVAGGSYDKATGQATLEYPAGFLMTYCMEWADWVKTDLTALANMPASRVQKELSEVKNSLRQDLADLALRETNSH